MSSKQFVYIDPDGAFHWDISVCACPASFQFWDRFLDGMTTRQDQEQAGKFLACRWWSKVAFRLAEMHRFERLLEMVPSLFPGLSYDGVRYE